MNVPKRDSPAPVLRPVLHVRGFVVADGPLVRQARDVPCEEPMEVEKIMALAASLMSNAMSGAHKRNAPLARES